MNSEKRERFGYWMLGGTISSLAVVGMVMVFVSGTPDYVPMCGVIFLIVAGISGLGAGIACISGGEL